MTVNKREQSYTVAIIIEWAVQPHRVRISSGGGGGDQGGWKNEDKNKYKSRRRS